MVHELKSKYDKLFDDIFFIKTKTLDSVFCRHFSTGIIGLCAYLLSGSPFLLT